MQKIIYLSRSRSQSYKYLADAHALIEFPSIYPCALGDRNTPIVLRVAKVSTCLCMTANKGVK